MSDASDLRTKLRDAILRGEFAPRQRLIEAELSEEYGASRFVVRTALNRLASDGLVELQPNRGARVREISVDEAIEITEIREQIEGLVAARAAERITDEQIATLTRIGVQMQDATESGELLRYSELNVELHGTLRAIAQHETANRMLELLNGQMVRHQFRLSLVPGRPSVSLPEHLSIIEAVCARDPEGARAAMSAHVTSVIATLRTQSTQARAGFAPVS